MPQAVGKRLATHTATHNYPDLQNNEPRLAGGYENQEDIEKRIFAEEGELSELLSGKEIELWNGC
jgi:hypothetical protein